MISSYLHVFIFCSWCSDTSVYRDPRTGAVLKQLVQSENGGVGGGCSEPQADQSTNGPCSCQISGGQADLPTQTALAPTAKWDPGGP